MANKYEDRLKDYVDVAARVTAFYAKHPNGSIQSEITHLTDKLVVVKAWAYRDPDDPRPGVGHSSLGIPGTTPYTRGSEVENAETSAWGRAIAALGFEVRKGIATRDEIENKQDDNANGNEERVRQSELGALVTEARQRCGSKEAGDAWLKAATKELGVTSKTISLNQIRELFERALILTPPDEGSQEEELDIEF